MMCFLASVSGRPVCVSQVESQRISFKITLKNVFKVWSQKGTKEKVNETVNASKTSYLLFIYSDQPSMVVLPNNVETLTCGLRYKMWGAARLEAMPTQKDHYQRTLLPKGPQMVCNNREAVCVITSEPKVLRNTLRSPESTAFIPHCISLPSLNDTHSIQQRGLPLPLLHCALHVLDGDTFQHKQSEQRLLSLHQSPFPASNTSPGEKQKRGNKDDEGFLTAALQWESPACFWLLWLNGGENCTAQCKQYSKQRKSKKGGILTNIWQKFIHFNLTQTFSFFAKSFNVDGYLNKKETYMKKALLWFSAGTRAEQHQVLRANGPEGKVSVTVKL